MNTSRFKLLCLAALGLMSGCATTVSLNESERASLKSNAAPIQTLLYTSLGSNGLAITTYGTAMAGPGSVYVAVKNGKEWAQENNIPHPMVAVRDQLVGKLKSDLSVYSFKHLDATLDIGEESPEKLKARLGNGLVMDFTGTYQVIYYLAAASKYHMYFNGRARLVRLDDGKVMWVGNCRTDIEDPDNKPSIDDLRANQAARLKQWLGRGAAECGKQLTDQFFGRSA
ncbi:MAG TPA: hypothetical protein VN277_03690 [Acidiferrobacterales bacterium]|nr:hypothetical protein [Acidiferrobacterales bacterium]